MPATARRMWGCDVDTSHCKKEFHMAHIDPILPSQGAPVERTCLGHGRLQLEIVSLAVDPQTVPFCRCDRCCFVNDDDESGDA